MLFDFLTVVALFAVALLLKTNASLFLAVEKLLMFVLMLLLLGAVSDVVYGVVFSYLALVSVYIIHTNLRNRKVLRFGAVLLAMLHASVVVTYYLLPYQVYLTVYNAYPKLYLVVVAFQTIGVADGNNRIGAIVRWPLCLVTLYLLINFFNRASYQRVKTQ